MFNWDIFGYYIYLPAAFIDHDICFANREFIDRIFHVYEPSPYLYQLFELPNHNLVSGYTIGLSLIYLPFFLVGHCWALIGDYPADGFSFPYQFAVGTGMLLFTMSGILVLRKLLLEFFSDKVVAIVIIILLWGTNYYREITQSVHAVQPALFACYAFFIYLLNKWYKDPQWKTSVLLGAVSGLMAEIRGSEVLIVLLFAFWNTLKLSDLKNRFLFWLSNFRQVLLIGIAALVIFIPQFINWKVVTGQWYFNNYMTAEGFNFSRPHLLDIFFSFKKSLLIWTPVLIFAIAGIVMMKKRLPKLFLPVVIFAICNTYLLSCWLLWWEAESFGLRYFVQSYALMSIPFGVCITGIFQLKPLLRTILFSIIAFFIFLNIFQTWQVNQNIFPLDRMTARYYKAIFLKTKMPEGAESLMEINRNTEENGKLFAEEKYSKKTVAFFNFENINTSVYDPAQCDSSHAVSPPYSYRLDKDHPYSPAMRLPYSAITEKEFAWLRVTVSYYCDSDININNAGIVLHAILDGTGRKEDKYANCDFNSKPFKKGEWNTITFDYQTPYPFYRHEPVLAYVWLKGNYPLFIDDFQVESFEPR